MRTQSRSQIVTSPCPQSKSL